MNSMLRFVPSVASALALALCGALSLPGCCGDPVPERYDWDHSPAALVAARGTAGGYVPQMLAFRESLYGSPFVRLMGDGTLYYGTPTQVSARKLSEPQMQELLLKLRPDLFGDYKTQYSAGMATDMPTTTIQIDVEDWGSHAVGIYGLSSAASDQSAALPSTLLDAAAALQQAATGGVPHAPKTIRIGAETIDLVHYPDVDATKVKDWPLAGVDLGKASIFGPPEQGIVLSAATQVNQVLSLFKGKEDVYHPQTGVVFRQGAATYWVAHIVMVP